MLAAIFFTGGILAAVLGFVLVAVRSVVPDEPVGEIGTVLMIVTIPLLLTGSHLMDVVDSRRAAARSEKAGAETPRGTL